MAVAGQTKSSPSPAGGLPKRGDDSPQEGAAGAAGFSDAWAGSVAADKDTLGEPVRPLPVGERLGRNGLEPLVRIVFDLSIARSEMRRSARDCGVAR